MNDAVEESGNKFGFHMDEITGIIEAKDSEVEEDIGNLESLTDYAKYKDELTAEPDTLFPAFALMYKLKPEYMTKTFSVATADHKNYCKEFERLLNDEIISMPKHKGVVMLFVGLSEDDKDETLAEVNKFVDKDPLVTLGIVETWNILDLDPDNKEDIQISVTDGREGIE